MIEDYLRLFKLRLEEIYGIKVNGVKIRSKCDWYKYGEKTSYFFLKNRFVQSQIRKLIIEVKELTEQNEIINNIFTFYQDRFSKQTDFKQNDLINYLDKINLPLLKNLICDAYLLKNKTPGNDGLSKEFYKVCQNDVKIPLRHQLMMILLKKN